jgi:hypothetical protein
MWWSRDKAVIERVKFVNIPLILVAYNGVSTGKYTSEGCSVTNKSNGPEEVNKAWPGALITDAFSKSCTRNESPVRVSVWVHFDNNAFRVGRAIVGGTELHV